MNLIEANLLIVPVAVVVYLSIAVFTDLKSRQIPNWLTVSSLVIAMLFHFFSGGLPALLLSLGGFATGFGILFVLWIIGGGGGASGHIGNTDFATDSTFDGSPGGGGTSTAGGQGGEHGD